MRVAVLILLILVLSLNVKAIAVASDFLENNRLKLIEGTSKIYRINLQNPDSFETIYRVDYSDEHMKAIDFKEDYILPPESSVTIEFNVTAPKYIKNNNLFPMAYTVHQLTGPSGGAIGFLGKINKNFKLEVIKNPDRFHINYFYTAYGVIMLAIVFFLYKKKRT